MPDIERWTICMHVTSRGDYERAQKIAVAMERAAERAGAVDVMGEILEQDPARP
jgi:hypothetical protein